MGSQTWFEQKKFLKSIFLLFTFILKTVTYLHGKKESKSSSNYSNLFFAKQLYSLDKKFLRIPLQGYLHTFSVSFLLKNMCKWVS